MIDSSLKRRHFLQIMGAAGGIAAVPTWAADMAAASTPIGDSEGVLIYLMMNGGNDSLNTLIPIQDPAYYGARGSLAISASESLPLTASRNLHPSLPTLKALYDRGEVAFVEGIGDPTGNMSHFDSMAKVQNGDVGSGRSRTGWLGRYLDGISGPTDYFHGVAMGYDLPLVAKGSNRQATLVPNSMPSSVRASTANEQTLHQFEVLRGMGGGGYGRGPLADRLGAINGEALDVAASIEGMFPEESQEDSLANQMAMVARLINANIGIRVVTLDFGSFDTHSDQAPEHAEWLAEFDQALASFYAVLSETFASRTLIYTMSEFGRRVAANGSAGTDHGAGGLSMAIGRMVRGGMYGEPPSLTQLDPHGNLAPTTNYRDAYGTILKTWLGANADGILGGSTTNLGFLAPPQAGAGPPPILASTDDTAHRRAYDSIIRLYLAYFGRTPEQAGLDHWLGQSDLGLPAVVISDTLAGSEEFRLTYGALDNPSFVNLVYQNVLARPPDAAGAQYWTELLNGGASRGSVMLGFSDSPEFIAFTKDRRQRFDEVGPVGRLYRAYFLRRPDSDGLYYWLSTGHHTTTISQQFSLSEEFVQTYGALSNHGFASLIYENVLSREAEAEGLAYWTDKLDSGLSRGEVMLGFSDSPEFISKVEAMS